MRPRGERRGTWWRLPRATRAALVHFERAAINRMLTRMRELEEQHVLWGDVTTLWRPGPKIPILPLPKLNHQVLLDAWDRLPA